MTPDERFERIEETLDAIDVRLDRAVKQGEQTDARLDRISERLDRGVEQGRLTDARLDRGVEQGKLTDARLDRGVEQGKLTDARLDRISERLDRAVRLSVREARSERNKRRELDEKMTQLAAAQLITEEKLQGLIEALKRGGNGHG
jgi:hypothetical protein